MKLVVDSSLELDITQVKRISGVSQSNVIVIMNTGETHTGHVCEIIK